jgi:hypothetical protein
VCKFRIAKIMLIEYFLHSYTRERGSKIILDLK